jgi:hypothetical protein
MLTPIVYRILSKYITITIPTGCNQPWDDMLQQSAGKHCAVCQKTVIDFSSMTDTQLGNFFKNRTDNVCGRFHPDQLDKEIMLPKKAMPWLKYFFTIGLPALLFSQKSFAQNGMRKDKPTTLKNNYQNPKTISSAQIILEEPKKDSIIDLDPVIIKSIVSGNRRVCYISGATVSSKSNTYTLFKPKIQKKLNAISIFPNPILQNSKLTISWEKNVTANQFIEIFSANGNLMQKEMISIYNKTQNAFIFLKQLPTGFYILKITDTKTRFALSKEFIVQ